MSKSTGYTLIRCCVVDADTNVVLQNLSISATEQIIDVTTNTKIRIELGGNGNLTSDAVALRDIK